MHSTSLCDAIRCLVLIGRVLLWDGRYDAMRCLVLTGRVLLWDPRYQVPPDHTLLLCPYLSAPHPPPPASGAYPATRCPASAYAHPTRCPVPTLAIRYATPSTDLGCLTQYP
eukprot:3537214-Rhodomonas_salina.1